MIANVSDGPQGGHKGTPLRISWAHQPLLNRSLIDAHNGAEELESIGLFALERVAPNDRARTAPIANSTCFIKHLIVSSGCHTCEDDDTATSKGTLDDVLHKISQR